MTKTLSYYISKGVSANLITKYLNEVFGDEMEEPLTLVEVKEAIGYMQVKNITE